VIEPQRKLLGDAIRNRAFAEAIRRAVQPGKTRVADLGTGTGFLAILAAQAGARSVWACDQHAGVVGLARQVAKDNGCPRIRFAVGYSVDLAPPEPVDLIIAEVLGHFAGEEHLVESLGDARRWLAPGGRCIPGRVEQWLCPVTGDGIQRGIDIFAATGCPVDLGAARAIALNNGYVRTVPPEDLLERGGAARLVDHQHFPGDEPSRRRGEAGWDLAGPTAIHGLCLWWVAELWPGVTLSVSPLEPSTHWEQIYLPLERPLECRRGDHLAVELRWDTRWQTGCVVHWSGRLRRAGRDVARFAQDNLRGFLK
jgi:protein arginine N-methyltransferase 1